MRIERLELENFRSFVNASFDFPALFTVLLGDNGRGKSAVLEGLRVAAGAWLLGFNETERLHIEPEDVRRTGLHPPFAPVFPVVVRATGVVEGQPVQWTRQRRDFKAGMGRTGEADAHAVVALARQCDKATNTDLQDIDLPVLAYFDPTRLWTGPKRAIALKKKGSKIQDGYAQALLPAHKRTGTPSRTVALGWIKKICYLALEETAGMRPGRGHTTPPLYYTTVLATVFQAITTCVPGWSQLRWDSETDDLSGLYQRPDEGAERVPLFYLSDGLRTMAGLVTELAYRCVTLNGHLGKDALHQSKGLVLIEGLELYLPADWQRRVASDLKQAFPSLQFVATTCSPLIVQGLDNSEVLDLGYSS